MPAGTQRPSPLDLGEAWRRVSAQGGLEHLHGKRWGRAPELAAWLDQEALAGLSPDQAAALYRASGGARMAEFRANPLDDVRDSLDFLLYDTISLENRFAECAAADGAYKLSGAGKEWAAYLLCLREPELFAPWRTYTERALRRLGLYPKTLGDGHLGLRYLDLLDVLQAVRRSLALPDFQCVDSFCYLAARSGGPPAEAPASGS